MLNYLDNGKSTFDRADRELVFSSLGGQNIHEIEDAFRLTRELYIKQGGVEYHHASLALDPDSSLTPSMDDSKLTNLAKDFVESFAPGHDYAVFIHRDTEHPHAHVLWNSVNFESGKKFHSSKKDLYRAVEIKNSLDEKYGLEITPGFGEKTRSLDFIRDRELRRFERDSFEYSWKEDLKTRIISAKDQSQTFEEYILVLSKLDVEPVLRGKDDPKVTYKFLDRDGKQRRIREKNLGENYTRQEIKNQIESRNLKLQALREISREPDREFERRPAELQPRPSESFSSFGERDRDQGIDHRASRSDISPSFEPNRPNGPELGDIGRELLREPSERYQTGISFTQPESLLPGRYPEQLEKGIKRCPGKELGITTQTERRERSGFTTERADFSDSLDRCSSNPAAGDIHGLVNPETVLELEPWRRKHAEYLGEQGKSFLRRREKTPDYEQNRADRNNQGAYEKLLRFVVCHGISTYAGLTKIRERAIDKISEFRKFFRERFDRLRERFKESRELSYKLEPKIDRNIEHARKLVLEQRLEHYIEVEKERNRQKEIQQERARKIEHRFDRGFTRGF